MDLQVLRLNQLWEHFHVAAKVVKISKCQEFDPFLMDGVNFPQRTRMYNFREQLKF